VNNDDAMWPREQGGKYPSPIKGMEKVEAGAASGGEIKVWITFKDKTYVGQTLAKQTQQRQCA